MHLQNTVTSEKEHARKPLVSVFAEKTPEDFWITYAVEFSFLDKVGGSIPADPVSIAEMVRRQYMATTGMKRADIDNREILEHIRRTLEEVGETVENLDDVALMKIAESKASGKRNAFRHDDNGLWLSSYQVISAFKETINSLYGGERWGNTKKGPKSYIVENLFVEPAHLYLFREDTIVREPDGYDTQHGNVGSPTGDRAIVTEHDFIQGATIHFRLRVLGRSVDWVRGEKSAAKGLKDLWPEIFSKMEAGGIGGHRKAEEYGKFLVTQFEKVG